ncbi:MAG: HAD family hydrolase [Lachnospiraceae bacterium]|nr:HAD family hydrolase [Lachnospiraceae bacterium]
MAKYQYDNYVFDLYGTLIDIHTDEGTPLFWKQIATLYRTYGADYTPAELRKTYSSYCKEAEKKLRAALGYQHVELCLDDVFLRLLTECGNHRTIGHTVGGRQLWQLSPGELRDCGWLYDIANTFRVLSRTKLRAFPGTAEMLGDLKKAGKKVYLLSNAQAIFTRPEIEQTGLMPFFDDVFISSEQGIKKPEPEFLRRLMKKHALTPENTLFTGNDIAADVGIALSCGLKCNFYNTEHIPAGKLKKQIEAVVSAHPGSAAADIVINSKAACIF